MDPSNHGDLDGLEPGAGGPNGDPVARRERLQREELEAQRLESLGQLAGGVAHDFNNLLGVILNYSSFVNEELVRAAAGDTSVDWDAVQRDIAQVQRAANRATVLTHQLLAFGRREVVRTKVLVLNEIVSDVGDVLRRTLGEHIEMISALDPGLWSVLADRGQIEQILLNLAVNARDAMPDGGTVSIQTDNFTVDDAYGRPLVQPGPYARLRVSDTGRGMGPDVIRRAFEPFFSTKPKGERSGLGLATVYGIVTQSGGHARIYSELGFGTTFSVLFPTTDRIAQPSESHDDHPRHGGGETVLVVEDEDAMREVTERILTRNGYKVITAPSGPAALLLVEGHSGPIDLLLTDVVMPEMLGREVASRVIALRPDVQVLYMSGYAQLILGANGRLDAGLTLVEKPFSEPALLAKLKEALDAPLPAR